MKRNIFIPTFPATRQVREKLAWPLAVVADDALHRACRFARHGPVPRLFRFTLLDYLSRAA